MLYIQTDLENTNWLRYIIDEFLRIQNAFFEIELINLDEKYEQINVIFYSDIAKGDVSVYSSKQFIPTGKLEYLSETMFIIKGTQSKGLTLNYDIFWNAFVFLSRYEEYISEKKGKYIYSYSNNHPRDNKKSFEVPIVNIFFNELETLIKKYFPKLRFGKKQKATIELSHDVDYINKTLQLRIKQTAFNIFKTLKSFPRPSKVFKNLIKTTHFFLSSPSYWCFEYWRNLEKKCGVRSTFYIYVKFGKQSIKSWLIDPSYDISTNVELQTILKEMKKEGFEIGLHGSYESAKNFEKLKKEKEILEKILGFQIIKTRQHWLNYYEKITPYNHEELFKSDSTLGWNDRIGFRSGIASKYHPYDHINGKAFIYEVIPQVIMDSNVYDYTDDVNIFSRAKKILKDAEHLSKTPCISISWHQRVCSNDYKWHQFYEEYIHGL